MGTIPSFFTHGTKTIKIVDERKNKGETITKATSDDITQATGEHIGKATDENDEPTTDEYHNGSNEPHILVSVMKDQSIKISEGHSKGSQTEREKIDDDLKLVLPKELTFHSNDDNSEDAIENTAPLSTRYERGMSGVNTNSTPLSTMIEDDDEENEPEDWTLSTTLDDTRGSDNESEIHDIKRTVAWDEEFKASSGMSSIMQSRNKPETKDCGTYTYSPVDIAQKENKIIQNKTTLTKQANGKVMKDAAINTEPVSRGNNCSPVMISFNSPIQKSKGKVTLIKSSTKRDIGTSTQAPNQSNYELQNTQNSQTKMTVSTNTSIETDISTNPYSQRNSDSQINLARNYETCSKINTATNTDRSIGTNTESPRERIMSTNTESPRERDMSTNTESPRERDISTNTESQNERVIYTNTVSPRERDISTNTESPRERDISTNTESPRERDISTNTESPRERDISTNTEPPRERDISTNTESPRERDIYTNTESPRERDISTNTESPRERNISTNTESPRERNMSTNTESPRERNMSTNTGSPKERNMSTNTESPRERNMSTNTESPRERDMSTNTESPRERNIATNTDSPRRHNSALFGLQNERPLASNSEFPKENNASINSNSPKENDLSGNTDSEQQNEDAIRAFSQRSITTGFDPYNKDEDAIAKPGPYESLGMQRYGKYKIRLESEDEKCTISAATFLEAGDLVVIDRSNKKVKFVDANFKYVSSEKLSAKPWAVCSIGTDIYVTMGNTQVQHLRVEEMVIEPIQIFEIKGRCLGICVFNEYLAIGLQIGEICLMDTIGETKDRIKLPDLGNGKICNPWHLCVTPENNFLVTDSDAQEIFCINKKAEIVFTFKGVSSPRGTAIDTQGNIIVVGRDTDTGVVVMVIHKDTELQNMLQIRDKPETRTRTLLTWEELEFVPYCVSYRHDNVIVLGGIQESLKIMRLL